MRKAVLEDISKEYLKAVASYEDEIATQGFSVPLDSFINLAFLYWSFATELFEFVIPNNIPDEWSIIGGERYELILDKGIQCYPNSVELRFWKRYFSFRLYGEDITEEECIALLDKYDSDDSLVPYFFLYLYDKAKYKEQRDLLIATCKAQPTAKNLYIQSFND
jgi:hypothetical protein